MAIDLKDYRLERLMKFGEMVIEGNKGAERSMYIKGAQDAWYLSQLIECEQSDGGAKLRDILALLGEEGEENEGYWELFKKPLLEIIQRMINHRDNAEAKDEDDVDEP